MKQIKVLLIGAIGLLLVSCGDKESEAAKGYAAVGGSPEKNDKAFARIVSSMDNPAGVYSINLGQLMDKSAIKEDPAIGMQVSMAMGQAKMINMNEPVRVAVEGTSPEDMWVSAMVSINSKADLGKVLKSTGAKVDSKKGYDLATIDAENYKVLVGYNDNVALIGFAPRFAKKSELEGYVEKLFKRASDSKVKVNPMVVEYLSSKEDIGLLLSMENIMKMVPEEELRKGNPDYDMDAAMAKLRGGWSIMTMNFSEGKIEMAAKNSYPEYDIEGLMNDKLPAEYAKSFTMDKFFGYMGGSVNVSEALNMLKDADPTMFDKFKKESGLDLKEVAAMFDGNGAFALIDLKGMEGSGGPDVEEIEEAADDSFDMLEGEEVEEGTLAMKESMDVDEAADEASKNIMIVIGLADQAKFITVLDTVAKIKMISPGVYTGVEDQKMFLGVGQNKLFLSGNQDAVQALVAGRGVDLSPEIGTIMESPMSGYLNLNAMAKAFLAMPGMKEGGEILEAFSKVVFKGNHESFEMEVLMTDPQTNALQQLIKIIMENSGAVSNSFGDMVM